MRIILASSSKQRQDIFNMIRLKYDVITSSEPEESNQTDPNKYVEELSLNKAKFVRKQINSKAIIISADTIIYCNNKIYEKPKSKEERFEKLQKIVKYQLKILDNEEKYNIQELEEKLKRCRNMKLEDVTLNDVDELSSIKIDRRKSSNERILDFLTKLKNSYIFKINGRLVRIRFSENIPTTEDCLTNVLKNLYR